MRSGPTWKNRTSIFDAEFASTSENLLATWLKLRVFGSWPLLESGGHVRQDARQNREKREGGSQAAKSV